MPKHFCEILRVDLETTVERILLANNKKEIDIIHLLNRIEKLVSFYIDFFIHFFRDSVSFSLKLFYVKHVMRVLIKFGK